MLNLLKIELYKLKKSKLFYFFFILTIMQAFVVYGFSNSARIKNGKEILEYILSMQAGLGTNIIIGIYASEIIVTEFTSGYIKNLISYGHKRTSIFISKSLAYYLSAVIMNLTVPICMMVLNTLINGFGEAFSFHSLAYLIRVFFLAIIIQIGIASCCTMAAFASRNLNITIAIAFVLDFVSRFINIMVVQKSMLYWAYNNFIPCLPGVVFDGKAGTTEFIHAIIVSLITIFITNTVGSYVFSKADIR